jgi:hypothetical protein
VWGSSRRVRAADLDLVTTESRLYFWTGIETLALFLVAAVQVYYLKNIMLKRRVI